MSLPKYPQHKESDVPWMKSLPAHWSIRQTKRHFSRRKEVNAGMKCEHRLALTMAGVIPRSIDDLDGLQSSDYEGYQIFEAGDLAFKLIDLQNVKTSRVGLVPERGIMSPAYVRLVGSHGVDIRFAYWYFMALYWTQVFNGLGGGVRQTLGPEELLTIPLPLPPAKEQRRIARFLDIETVKIDALIAEQEKLLALLAEKRQTTISHAVTRGLDPNVETRDAGVQVLGDVPAHWVTAPIKRFFEVLDGRRVPLSSEERSYRQGNYPYYGASGVIDAIDDYLFDEDLVLVSEDGANLLNRASPIAFVARGKYWVNNHAHILRPRDGLVDYWAARIEAIDLAPVVTGAAQPKLTIDALANLMVAAPADEEERAEISRFIATTDQGMRRIEAEVDHAIKLLKERRSALITAVVTGQVDVRSATA